MKMENRRRRNFIDKDFQSKFILKFCVIVLISSLLIGGLLFFFSRNSTTVAIENTKVVVKRTADYILPVIITILLITTFFSALVMLIVTLSTSHKIAGPLYRCKREIDILKEGDLRRNFNIRTKDQLQELAKSLNAMCNALKQKHMELKDKCHSLKSYLGREKLKISAEEKDELSKILEDIDATISYFKV